MRKSDRTGDAHFASVWWGSNGQATLCLAGCRDPAFSGDSKKRFVPSRRDVGGPVFQADVSGL